METHQPANNRAIVFAGGAIRTTPPPDSEATVIAADSGYDHAVGLGHRVDLLVGDLDSISECGLAHAEAEEIEIDRHPTSKDATDLELALEAATRGGASAIDIYGGEEGRIDHLLAIAVGLTDPGLAGIDVTWHTETATVRPLVDGGHLHPDAIVGAVVSIIVVSDCVGVTTQGLKWQLLGEDLRRGTSRGVSNEVVQLPVSVSLDTGAALVVTESVRHS